MHNRLEGHQESQILSKFKIILLIVDTYGPVDFELASWMQSL